ncbi:MAG: flavodoxin domain-containing protein [Spirochaetales bacterium]|nr:flavodoxin domain-containing protein [Spirochaetales bacterium]
MNEPFKAVKITDTIYWVGAIDWSLRDFHGYSTSRGSTYNAYLILADKITLVDTVKAPYKDELIARISSLINPEDINYIISNHSEMDHSGCLAEVMRIVKPEATFASAMGVKTLSAHFAEDKEIAAIKAVQNGEVLDLGNMSITFLETKMLHWPDSMISYIPQQKFLFSQDAFGMHCATSKRFADEIPADIIEYESEKYYANILLPYSHLIAKLVQKIKDMGLEFDIIAPDHGPVWRKNPLQIVSKYVEWAEQKPREKVIISYDTMWKSTDLMARSIADGIMSKGMEVKLLPLSSFHRSDVMTELLTAGALIIGSPTMNNNLYPTVADLFFYMKGLKPKNLIGFAFGAYGWSGESITQAEEFLKEMNVELTNPGIKAKYVPTGEVLIECYNRGAELAEKLSLKCTQ